MSKIKKFFIFILPVIFISFLVLGLINKPKSLESKALHKNLSESNQEQTLRFVQLTDVHTDVHSSNRGKRLLRHSRELLADAINRINCMKDIDFVIFTGDSINTPRESNLTAFSQEASRLNYPWFVVLGNHDVGVRSSFNKEKFYQILKRYNSNQNNILPYYTFVPKKGYVVIVMDGVIDSRITAHGYFSKKELTWLEEQLKANKDSKVIIAQHFPLLEPIKSSDHYVLNKQEYLNILNKYSNVIAVISGHYHVGKITQVDNITHISTPALVQYPSAFRVITVTTDKNNYTKIKIETKETNLKHLQKSLKN